MWVELPLGGCAVVLNMSYKERLIELRGSKYFYEDVKIHTFIDTWDELTFTPGTFQLSSWEAASHLQKSIYKAIARQQLIVEGIIKD